MNTISAINSVNSYSYNYNPTFKSGKSSFGRGFFQGARGLAGMTEAYKELPKEQVKATKNSAKPTFLQRVSNVVRKIADGLEKLDGLLMTPKRALRRATKIDPELTNNLVNVGKVSNQEYSPYSILRIVEEKNKNGQMAAYELANYLNFEEPKLSLRNTDYLISKYKNEPRLAENYKMPNAKNTVDLLKAHDMDNAFMDKLWDMHIKHQRYSKEEMLGLSNLRNQFKEETEQLIDSPFEYKYDDIRVLAPEWMAHHETISSISKQLKEREVDINGKQIVGLIDAHDVNPERFSTLLKDQELNDNWASELAVKAQHQEDVTSFINEYEMIAMFPQKQGMENYVNFSLAADTLLASVKECKSLYEADTSDGTKAMALVEKFKLSRILGGKTEILKKIAADGRKPESAEELIKLVSLYENYPDTKITPEMIELSKNPIANCFNLTGFQEKK